MDIAVDFTGMGRRNGDTGFSGIILRLRGYRRKGSRKAYRQQDGQQLVQFEYQYE
jgi:hypothetical protein